jgi:hypothetical protein
MNDISEMKAWLKKLRATCGKANDEKASAFCNNTPNLSLWQKNMSPLLPPALLRLAPGQAA